jgi:hypothetical protein
VDNFGLWKSYPQGSLASGSARAVDNLGLWISYPQDGLLGDWGKHFFEITPLSTPQHKRPLSLSAPDMLQSNRDGPILTGEASLKNFLKSKKGRSENFRENKKAPVLTGAWRSGTRERLICDGLLF